MADRTFHTTVITCVTTFTGVPSVESYGSFTFPVSTGKKYVLFSKWLGLAGSVNEGLIITLLDNASVTVNKYHQRSQNDNPHRQMALAFVSASANENYTFTMKRDVEVTTAAAMTMYYWQALALELAGNDVFAENLAYAVTTTTTQFASHLTLNVPTAGTYALIAQTNLGVSALGAAGRSDLAWEVLRASGSVELARLSGARNSDNASPYQGIYTIGHVVTLAGAEDFTIRWKTEVTASPAFIENSHIVALDLAGFDQTFDNYVASIHTCVTDGSPAVTAVSVLEDVGGTSATFLVLSSFIVGNGNNDTIAIYEFRQGLSVEVSGPATNTNQGMAWEMLASTAAGRYITYSTFFVNKDVGETTYAMALDGDPGTTIGQPLYAAYVNQIRLQLSSDAAAAIDATVTVSGVEVIFETGGVSALQTEWLAPVSGLEVIIEQGDEVVNFGATADVSGLEVIIGLNNPPDAPVGATAAVSGIEVIIETGVSITVQIVPPAFTLFCAEAFRPNWVVKCAD